MRTERILTPVRLNANRGLVSRLVFGDFIKWLGTYIGCLADDHWSKEKNCVRPLFKRIQHPQVV